MMRTNTSLEFNNILLSCHINTNDDGRKDISGHACLDSYTDEDILIFMKENPKITFIRYESKSSILSSIKSGKFTINLINDKIFVIGRDSDGTSSLMLVCRNSSNVKLVRDTISQEYKRFIKLLLLSKST